MVRSKNNLSNLIIPICFGIILIIGLIVIVTFMNRYLSKRELEELIVDSHAKYQSKSKPNREYKIVYNKDGTFEMDTLVNGTSSGKTTGTYSIDSYLTRGCIVLNYDNITESPNKESTFNKSHPNTIHKTKQRVLGPFELISSDRSGKVVKYKYKDLDAIDHMTVFHK